MGKLFDKDDFWSKINDDINHAAYRSMGMRLTVDAIEGDFVRLKDARNEPMGVAPFVGIGVLSPGDSVWVEPVARMVHGSVTRFLSWVVVGKVGPIGELTVSTKIATSGGQPTAVALAGAGSTSSASVVGNSITGTITVNPSGTGIAAGSVATITFPASLGTSTYAVIFTPQSTGARNLSTQTSAANKTATGFNVTNQTPLISGTQYVWDYVVVTR